MKTQYKHLFSPLRIRDIVIKNRIEVAPFSVFDLDTTPERHASERDMEFFRMRAMGGGGIITAGDCIVHPSGVDSGHLPSPKMMACNYDNLPFFTRIADEIHRYDAIASMELNHAGMLTASEEMDAWGPDYINFTESKTIAPLSEQSAETEPVYRKGIVRQMTEEMIEEVVDGFGASALLAKNCGFEMVMIHAGHGWLIHQFLSPSLNTRRDRWGGAPIENRARFGVAVCEAVRKAVGPGFPIEIRISGSEVYEGGYGVEEGIAFAKQLEDSVDMIHVSAGHHEVVDVFTVTHPSLFLEDGANVKYAAEIKKHVRVPVATVGALSDPDLMEEIIATGKADVVEAARAFIADPDFPRKARQGKQDEINRCMRCLSCFSALVLKGNFYCAINPKAGCETEMKSLCPPAEKKKVLVAGGGVAGMQAALTAAERGHAVILCEKAERLGGVLLCEDKVPFKQLLKRYLEAQARRVREAGVDIRLGTEVRPETVASFGADVVVAALGAVPAVPKIKGIELPHVLAAQDAYANPDKTGDTVVVLGGGLVGTELAVYLSMLGKKLSLVEMLPQLNPGDNLIHGMSLMPQIRKHGIDLHLSARAEEILPEGVRCVSCDSGESFTLAAQSVVFAAGLRPLADEGAALDAGSAEFFQIGDCVLPKNIMEATSVAFRIARNIGCV